MDRDYVLVNTSSSPSQCAGSAVLIGVHERCEVCVPIRQVTHWDDGVPLDDLGVGNL